MRCDVRKLMTLPILMLLAAPAAAQDVVYHFEQRGAPPGPGDLFNLPVPPPPPGAGGMIESRMGLLAVEPFEGAQPIVGAPYSADISTDVVQSLADGNRIEHHTTGSVARDGQGRVRRDQQLAAIGGILPQVDGRIVTINDPVAHVHYSLNPAHKQAMQMPLPVIKRLPGTPPPLPPAVESKGARVESLGTSDIEGVQAQGTRTTITIPAGAIGNQAPIEMVNERWFSPELGTIVMSRRSDPRFGETTYRVQNIVRAEPAADLFQIPSDYTVDVAPAFGKTTFVARPPSPPQAP